MQLNQQQIEKIIEFERSVRKQNLEGKEIRIAGSLSEYVLIFVQGEISYSTKNAFYSIQTKLLN